MTQTRFTAFLLGMERKFNATPEKIALMLKMNINEYYDIRNGDKNPTSKILNQIIEVLDFNKEQADKLYHIAYYSFAQKHFAEKGNNPNKERRRN